MPFQFDKPRWHEIKALLDQVLDLPKAQQLDKLQTLCSNDTALFEDAKLFLEQDDSALTYLERPALDLVDQSSPADNFIANGADVGPYTLCEEIGRGGMGVVYRAERSVGDFEQQVAIKFLLNWHTRRSQRERFSHEQKLLAKLEHPNIARLLDGGITKLNQPYLVMEYVSGTPIKDYCNQHALGVDARLQLFSQICNALAYAHSNLIVHRDIKPSNLLVTADSQIKLLDFGVAKLLDEEDQLNLTRTGDQVLTPKFASPEQFQNQAITVASDVYQLGLLIYELLTGKQAYESKTQDLAALVKLVCEQEPMRPSQAFHQSSPDEKIEISTKRGTDVKALYRKLKGEIDSIILKMLAIKPSDRYASMQSLQADITAYYEHRPISALPHNLFYSSQKMLRRHWKSLAVSGAFVSLLAAYAITSSVQANRIQQALKLSVLEQQKAQGVADFMVNIFKAADPNVAGLKTLTAQELLESGEQRLSEELLLDPAIHGHMLTSLGEIYYSQGDSAKSLELLQDALVKQRKAAPGNELALADTLTQLAMVYSTTNSYAQAQRYFKESEALYRRVSSPDSLEKNGDYAEMLNTYGLLQLKQGDLANAERYLSQAIKILRRLSEYPRDELAVALNNMAHYHTITGQLTAAKQSMREAIEIHEQTLGEYHSYFTVYLNNYGNLLNKLEQFDEAGPVFNRALGLQLDLLGDKHPYLLNTYRNLSTLAYERGQLDIAEAYLRRAFAVQADLSLTDELMTATLHKQLGQVLSATSRFEEAMQHFEKMQATYLELNVGDHLAGLGLCALAKHQYFQGDLSAAQSNYENALLKLSQTTLQQSVALSGLARVRLAQDQVSPAKSLIESALAIRHKKLGESHSQLIEAKAVLALINARLASLNEQEQLELTQLAKKMSKFPRHYYGGGRAIGAEVKVLIEALSDANQ